MNLQDLEVRESGNIVTISLNRPAVLNAIRMRTLKELCRVLGKVEGTRRQGVIVTGSGSKAFCSGGDLRELSRYNREDARAYGELAQRALATLEELPMPVVAAVNGLAFGAGCDIACVCDLVIASPNAKFAEPASRHGIISVFQGNIRLPRLIGLRAALWLLLTGEPIDASKALELGIVGQVVPQPKLLTAAEDIIKKVAANAPHATAYIKQLARASVNQGLDKLRKQELEYFITCMGERMDRMPTGAVQGPVCEK